MRSSLEGMDEANSVVIWGGWPCWASLGGTGRLAVGELPEQSLGTSSGLLSFSSSSLSLQQRGPTDSVQMESNVTLWTVEIWGWVEVEAGTA